MTGHNDPFPLRSDEELLQGQYELDIIEVLGDAFRVWLRYAGQFLLAGFLYAVVVFATCGLGLVLNGPVMAGFTYAAFRAMRGQPVELYHFMEGFKDFWHYTLKSALVSALTLLAFCCCVVPGLYLGVAWLFATPLMIERKLGWWQSLELSRKVVHRYFGLILALHSIVGIESLLFGASGFGSVLILPMASLVYVATYARIFGLAPVEQGESPIQEERKPLTPQFVTKALLGFSMSSSG